MFGKEVLLWGAATVLTVAALFAAHTMRTRALPYVLAMICAVAAALASTLGLASPVASWITSHMRFESPDGAASVHMFAFLGMNLVALVLGWWIGWSSGAAIQKSAGR